MGRVVGRAELAGEQARHRLHLVAPGEEGELVHSGPLVAQGYWNDSERTAERFRKDGIHSGDRVRIGKDGLLRIIGRDDAMIKVSGNRLSPQEIEEIAIASGAVREAAAFGIEDAEAGQVVALVAVAEGEEAEDRLRSYFAREAPAFMAPRRILWLEKLPTGATGKLDRAAMEGMIA
jgi:acyl-coenzyme A synthetase/AMP-(fatty) acid ligase